MAIVNLKSPVNLDRSKPPKSGKPKDMKFPGFFETKTSNGITVLVIEDKKLPLVTARFVFKSGAFEDYFHKADKAGLSSVTSELLTKGTQSRSAFEIADEVDYLGASIGSGCNYDASFVSSYSLKKYFNNIFDIISDVILNPSFKEEEIERVKLLRLNSLLAMSDDGDYLAEKLFNSKVYGDYPYSIPIDGESDSISELSGNDIREHYNKIFYPENLIVAFVGDITPDEALLKLNENFSDWKNPQKRKFEIPETPSLKPPKVYLIEKKGAVQSSIKAGHIGIKRSNPDYIPVSVMNTLLGGFFTSRINKNLREVNGFTYGARSVFHCCKHSGDFSVMTEVKTEITPDTLDEILKELNDIKNKNVSVEELRDVKNYISGNFPMQLETPNEIASKAIGLKLYELDDDYYSTYLQKVNQLTRDDIRRAAELYLHPENLIISIAGDVKALKSSLTKFGETEITGEIINQK